jgi:RNA polymerase sigma factor (sigma-70 family)
MGVFASTHWSVVLAAASGHGSEKAWELLCTSYWYPLYAFIRRDGYSPEDAQDLTQEFLARMIHRRQLEGIEAGKGKFRSFLLVRLKHFLSDERKRAGALKRGGDRTMVSWDQEMAEARYECEPADAATPDTLFDRGWALTVLDRVMDRLRQRYAARGRATLFQHLEGCLGGRPSNLSYSDIGALLGLDEGAVKVAAHRLRKEFGAELRGEIAQTVSDAAAIDAEIRELIKVASQ